LTARDKSKIEFSLFHRSEQVQQIDHRVLQDTHDRIAAFYRLTKKKEKHVSTPLEADAKTYREYLTESWKQYYFAEIDSLSKIVEFSTSVVSAVLYANQPEGYQAEDRIVAILDKRYGNEYWELLQGKFDNNKTSPGRIYVMVNSLFQKDLIKIGKTTRTSEERAKEISSGTGIPTEFNVAYDLYVANCDLAERIIHERLAKFRVSDNREFFKIPLKQAISIIEEAVGRM
jgi:T5orf172 domain